MFEGIKPGDTVTRLLAGIIPMPMTVTAVTPDRIICGAWSFSRANGAEIDEELGWDDFASGSYFSPDRS